MPSEPAAAAADVQPAKDEWPEDVVMLAKEQCMHQLASTPAEFEWLEPIRNGACGLPAPVRLKRLGAVTFSPPVHVNCRMVAALGTWIKSTLQPAAEARLKSRVVGIVGASGYSCRNIYNRPNARLSQHALANAVDIGGFSLANGRTVRVLNGWGLTARDVKAQEAKAKAKAAAEARAKAEAKAKPKGEAQAKAEGKEHDKATAAATGKAGDAASAEAKSADTKDVKDAKAAQGVAAGSAEAGRSGRGTRGGRGDQAATPVAKASLSTSAPLPIERRSVTGTGPAVAGAKPARPSNESLFLRAIHSGACGPFGTVLGPEANDPHRDHFHLDLIPRRSGRGYCQ